MCVTRCVVLHASVLQCVLCVTGCVVLHTNRLHGVSQGVLCYMQVCYNVLQVLLCYMLVCSIVCYKVVLLYVSV